MKNYNKKIGSHVKEKKGFWTTKFEEFCKRTDLHGYKYIVMEDLSVFERLVGRHVYHIGDFKVSSWGKIQMYEEEEGPKYQKMLKTLSARSF